MQVLHTLGNATCLGRVLITPGTHSVVLRNFKLQDLRVCISKSLDCLQVFLRICALEKIACYD